MFLPFILLFPEFTGEPDSSDPFEPWLPDSTCNRQKNLTHSCIHTMQQANGKILKELRKEDLLSDGDDDDDDDDDDNGNDEDNHNIYDHNKDNHNKVGHKKDKLIFFLSFSIIPC